MKRKDKMQDTIINNLNLTMDDISKFPNLPVSRDYAEPARLGTIYTTGQATLGQGTIYDLYQYKGVVYKVKGDWSAGEDSFHFRKIAWAEITFETIEGFQKIVKALNTLDACLKEIEEYTEKTLREKLNTNQRPNSITSRSQADKLPPT